MSSLHIPDVERRIELHSLSDPSQVIGEVEVVPEAGGCAVKSTVRTPELATEQRFIKSHIGRVPIPLYSARVALAAQTAAIKAELSSDDDV